MSWMRGHCGQLMFGYHSQPSLGTCIVLTWIKTTSTSKLFITLTFVLIMNSAISDVWWEGDHFWICLRRGRDGLAQRRKPDDICEWSSPISNRRFYWSVLRCKLFTSCYAECDVGHFLSKLIWLFMISNMLSLTRRHDGKWLLRTLITRSTGPTRGPSGADRTQVGPMLAQWTLLSGKLQW